MQHIHRFLPVFVFIFIIMGCSDKTPTSADRVVDEAATLAKHGAVSVSHADLVTFMAAGEYGGGVLEPGTFYPMTKIGTSTLYRGNGWISYKMKTSGLPPGAYTTWWVIFNNPDGCDGDCDDTDLLNPDANVSAFWSDGTVVGEDGIARFQAKVREGEVPDEPGQLVMGPDGLVDAQTAEVHLIVKYHGPASDDPDVLYEQTHTLLGSCFEGANAWDFGDPFGVQCFDPQVAVHKP